MSNLTLKNKVVFVTGANRQKGIGRALVEEAVKRGAKKVYATTRSIAQLGDLVARYPGIVVPLSLDVTNKADIERVAREASDTQILINNSGVAGYSGICFNHNEEMARQEMEVNYWGPLNLTRAFCKAIINNKNGAIANVISIGGLSTFPLAATYTASKAAAHSLTQAVRAELAFHDVPVFGIYPGPIDTDMADGLEFAKESPANAAIRIFDDMEQGIEDILPDDFAEQFVQQLRLDPKVAEKNIGDNVHRMPEGF
ncbi:MAG: SDR family oxidoreductase [Gammaproteobacteria bacterium]|nr:SDR family oxidoreductase [Gammaproteobacteria bacterium]